MKPLPTWRLLILPRRRNNCDWNLVPAGAFLDVTKVVPTGRRAAHQAAQSRSQEYEMNIHTDQRPAYGSDNKTGTTGSSGRSTTGDINADLNNLRSDFNALKETMTEYISKTGSDALDSAKKTTSDVANK